MTLRRSSTLLALVLGLCTLGNTGCVALLDAALKETDDHGRDARYENKSFGEHYLDSLLEDDDDCDCRGSCHHRSTVILVHEDC